MESEAKKTFFARVKALLNLVSNYENWESCRVDIVKTRANLLYHHAVRLGSLSIVEVSTIEKLRDVAAFVTWERSLMLISSCAVVWRMVTNCVGKLNAPVVKQKSVELDRKVWRLSQADQGDQWTILLCVGVKSSSEFEFRWENGLVVQEFLNSSAQARLRL